MKKLTQILSEHTRQLRREDPLIWLYEVQVLSDPPQRFRLTNYDRVVQFDTDSAGNPLSFRPFPIAHGDLRANRQGDLLNFPVYVGTPSLEMMQYFEGYDGLIGGEAVVRIVSRLELFNPQAQVAFVGEVTGCRVTAQQTTFGIGHQNLQQVPASPQRFTKYHCRHRYGGPACGAPIDNPTFLSIHPDCAQTDEACRDRGATEASLGLPVLHPKRIGAFKAIPRVLKR